MANCKQSLHAFSIPETDGTRNMQIQNAEERPEGRRAVNEEQKRRAAEARYHDLTETPVPKLILRLSVPTIVSMLVTAIYNAADTFFVGRISTGATAAVGLAFSVMAIIQAMGFFCG